MVQAQRGSGRRDVRWRALALTVLVVTLGGVVMAALSEGGVFGWRFPLPGVASSAVGGAQAETLREIKLRFQQGVVMLHAKRYEHAMTAFHRVLELDPAMPEAHVNMGFALIGLQRFVAARDFFTSAIELRRQQVNAYYGLALALDELQDRPGAIGAMRTFVHLSQQDDPYRRKALSALWEWESSPKTAGVTGDGRLAGNSPGQKVPAPAGRERASR